MNQPSTIYKPGKLKYLWNYLSSTLDNFKVKLLGYRSYVAIINQVDGDSPTAEVLENNIGPISFLYEATGLYRVVSETNAFVNTKTVSLCTVSTDAGNPTWLTTEHSDPGSVIIRSFVAAGTGADGINSATLEIRVYN
jgi:hypothetical protein